MLEAALPTAEVAARVGSSMQVVMSLRRRFVQTGSTADLPRHGRRRVTTRAQDHYILNKHIRNRFITTVSDNARPHVASENIRFLQIHNGGFTDNWPSKSPDFNPIEHLWDNLDRRIRRCPNPPGNVNELRAALFEDLTQTSMCSQCDVTVKH